MQSSARPPVWLWLNLLSLDAPVIALVWQDFLSRCYPAVLNPPGRCVLGLTVWAIYVADRLLDVRRPASAGESVRHRFYRQHRVWARGLLAVILAADLVVTGLWLRPDVFDNGLLVIGGVVVYLGAFSFSGWGALAWKKPFAALLFTAGTFLVEWTRAGGPGERLVWPAAAFCALCLGNLLAVGRWSGGDAAVVNQRAWPWIVFLAACLVCARGSDWFGAIVASAAGLFALVRWGRRISCDARCVLADAMLLTPLLFR